VYASAAQAAEEMVHLERRYEPDPTRAERYTERYGLYREVYPAVRHIQAKLEGVTR
jgi:sugar (pentulose or hexulose) kinase